MKTLSELYDFLEDKRDDKHIDGLLSYDAALPEEWQKARLEMLTWWKIERIVKDENCHIDRSFAVAYFVHSYDIDPHSYDVDPLEEGRAFKEQSLFACKQAAA